MSGLFAPTTRILLQLEFCGTHFCGWQLQSESVESQSKRSLQFHLERSVATALGRSGERFPVQGCGRTDSGVHALQYFCHFDLHRELESRVQDLQKFTHSLNGILPAGIAVLRARVVPLSFHALKSVRQKTYEYRVLLRKEAPTVQSDFMHWISAEIEAPSGRKAFDFEIFCKAAKLFVGTHDFAALASQGSSIKNTVRTINSLEIVREKFPYPSAKGDFLRLRFVGKGFLKQMVRNIAGTLFEVGLGKRSIDQIPPLLTSGTSVRRDAGMCAPGQGLFLAEVLYDPPLKSFDARPGDGG